MGEIIIKEANQEDIQEMVKVHRECFPEDGTTEEDSTNWIKANHNSFPRMRYYVAQEGLDMLGYILWMEKGGFRNNAIVELEQIGVSARSRGKGVGKKLILESFNKLQESIGRKIKLIEVTTSTENKAQELYKKTLGAEPECVLKNLFEGDEVIMVARK